MLAVKMTVPPAALVSAAAPNGITSREEEEEEHLFGGEKETRRPPLPPLLLLLRCLRSASAISASIRLLQLSILYMMHNAHRTELGHYLVTSAGWLL